LSKPIPPMRPSLSPKCQARQATRALGRLVLCFFFVCECSSVTLGGRSDVECASTLFDGEPEINWISSREEVYRHPVDAMSSSRSGGDGGQVGTVMSVDVGDVRSWTLQDPWTHIPELEMWPTLNPCGNRAIQVSSCRGSTSCSIIRSLA